MLSAVLTTVLFMLARPSADVPELSDTSAGLFRTEDSVNFDKPAFRAPHRGFTPGVEARVAHVINVLSIYENLLQTHELVSLAVSFTFDSSPRGGNWWSRAFNYPSFGFGLQWTPYHVLGSREGCGLGDMLSLYGIASFSVLRAGCFSTGPFLELGFCYADRIYDPVTNMRNRYVGGYLDGHVSIGWNFNFLLARHYEIVTSIAFTHHSIAKMFLPNSGVTEAFVSLGLRYHLDEAPGGVNSRQYRDLQLHPLYDKGLRWYIYAAAGAHSCQTIWTAEGKWDRTAPCFRGVVGVDAVWRYSPIFSTGVGLETMYTSGIDRLREADRILHPEVTDALYSPVRVGLDLIQQFHYRNVSLHFRLGAYLFKQTGVEESEYSGWCFQKIGIRYSFSRIPLFFGIEVRTHYFNSSDCLEFSAGVNLGRKCR